MTTEPSEKSTKSAVLPIIGIAASILLLAFAWWVAKRPTPTVSSPTEPTPIAEAKLTEEQIKAFFDSEVRPALDAYGDRNQVAVDRASERISNGVEKYGKGIKPFVEDITSFGTRFGVIRRLGSDLGEKWWGNPANATEVHKYVSAKFEKHLFSDAQLNTLVTSSLKQFRDDLAASQNILHADVKAAWGKSSYAQYELNFQKIIQQVNASVQSTSSKMATDSLTVGVVSFVAGNALADAIAKIIINRMAASIATSAAISMATSGGATAITMAAGGGGGTVLGGPVGTVIGVSAGLVVGIIADWWMTDQLEKKLTTECNQMVIDVKNQILIGTIQAPGLKYAFIESILLLKIGEEEAIHAYLREVAQ